MKEYTLKGENETIFDALYHMRLDPCVVEVEDNSSGGGDPESIWWVGKGDKIVKIGTDEKSVCSSGTTIKVQPSDSMRIIDVYLGFMDEEVNARLAKLIEEELGKKDEDQRRPVVLIERKKVKLEGPILEWPVANYPAPIREIIQVSPQEQIILQNKPLGEDEQTPPERIIAQALKVNMEWNPASDLDWLVRGLTAKRIFDVIKMLQHRGVPWTKSGLPDDVTGKGPWLSVVRFAVGNNNNPPIIVIRTPEMGLQPSLMCPYLAFLFKMLQGVSYALAERYDPKKKTELLALRSLPLRVSQFGVQGSTCDKKYFPGTTAPVVASLLVGVEVASDITFSGYDDNSKKTTVATYKHSSDSTENSPVWKVKNKNKVTPDYRKYSNIKAGKTDLHAFAVISLCTPAGVYDFVRKEIDHYQDLSGLVDTHKLDPNIYPSEEAEKAEKRYKQWEKDKADEVPSGKKINLARDIAADIFRNQSNKGNFKHLKLKNIIVKKAGPFAHFEKGIEVGMTLNEVIAEILKVYKDNFFYLKEREGIVTLTVTYFAGDLDKDAAFKLDLKGVNMEDYHILRVLGSAVAKASKSGSEYPLILGWRIDRINADPKKLPDKIEEKFSKHAGLGGEDIVKLTIDEYVEVIIWGLRGVLKTDIESNDKLKGIVDWKFLHKDANYFKGASDLKPYFWSYVTHPDGVNDGNRNTFWVPNPFCIEIATDFVNELSKIKLTANEQPVKGKKKAAGGIAGIENVLSNNELEKLKGLAKAVLEAWKKEGFKESFEAQMNSGKTVEAAKALMDEIYKKGLLETKMEGSGDRPSSKLNKELEQCEKDIKIEEEKIKAEQMKSKAIWGSSFSNTQLFIKATGRKRDLLSKQKKLLKKKEEQLDNPKLEAWLRPDKWGGITEPTLQQAVKNKTFQAAAIDRAFYKSSNMMALQEMADKFFWVGGKSVIPARGNMK